VTAPAVTPQPRARWSAVLLLAGVLIVPVGGVVLSVRGLTIVHRKAVATARGGDPVLSKADRRALGAPADAGALWSAGAAAGLARQLGADPAIGQGRIVEIDLFPSYAFIAIAGADGSDRVEHYEWRHGLLRRVTVGPGGSRLRPDTFSVGDVPWERLQSLMDVAIIHLGVTSPDAQYIEMDNGALGSDGLTLRLYVSGPTSRGGYLEADGSGRVRRIIAD